MSKISRRNFIKGAGVAALAVALPVCWLAVIPVLRKWWMLL